MSNISLRSPIVYLVLAAVGLVVVAITGGLWSWWNRKDAGS
jgi:hypothetical protein